MKKSIVGVNYVKNKVVIDLKITSVPEYTCDMPGALSVLKREIPTIFDNKCFNDTGKTFYEEAKNTQTAHLFEHIILENMCLAKIKYADSAAYNGKTFWDKYAKDKCYQIRLSVPLVDWPIFINAFTKSISLVNQMTTYPPLFKNQ